MVEVVVGDVPGVVAVLLLVAVLDRLRGVVDVLGRVVPAVAAVLGSGGVAVAGCSEA